MPNVLAAGFARLLVLAALATACADMRIQDPAILEHTDQLAPAPEREVFGVPDEVWFYERPGVEWSRYGSIVVEAPVLLPPPERSDSLSAEDRIELLQRFDAELRRVLGTRFRLVDAAQADSLRLRAAITDVQPQRPWLNWVTLVLIVPLSLGGISGELEVLDAATGERLLAMRAARDGTPFHVLEAFTRFGHAAHGMTKWARELLVTMTPPVP